MTWHSIEFWEIVLDVIGLLLCGTTIIYLIRNKAEYKQILVKAREPEERETTDFENVLIRSLHREERNLKSVPDNFEDESNDRVGLRFVDERYREVIRLSDTGLETKEISKKTNIPKSEVDLIIKLNKEAVTSNGEWSERKPGSRVAK